MFSSVEWTEFCEIWAFPAFNAGRKRRMRSHFSILLNMLLVSSSLKPEPSIISKLVFHTRKNGKIIKIFLLQFCKCTIENLWYFNWIDKFVINFLKVSSFFSHEIATVSVTNICNKFSSGNTFSFAHWADANWLFFFIERDKSCLDNFSHLFEVDKKSFI